ncbi:NUDIX hydrolase [Streptomyces chilikensis]|uniref:NUDIX domain-containing protein n=1 Tax=Streptomyces chilikensis TaxID=1194079 RepID=A0ABV3EIT6_9ACTN
MTPGHIHLRETVEAYLTRHPAERDALAGLLAAPEQPEGATSRAVLPGHVTCSAAVVDRDLRVLHVVRRGSGSLLVPGGHAEPGDRTLLAAAVREVAEKTGIPPASLCLTQRFLDAPADISVHETAARPDEGEPAHHHYDFRYVFYLTQEPPPPVAPRDGEASGPRWLPLDEVASPSLRAKLHGAGLDGRPEPVNACVLIHDGAGRYLLHLRDHLPGIWQPGAFALLGGGRKPGDRSPRDTLLRELAEEVPGLRLEDLEPYAVEEATGVDGLHVPVQVFSGRWRGDPDRLPLREGVLLRWFTPDRLDRLRLSPGLRDLIHQHASLSVADERPPAAVPPWDPGGRTILNGVGVHLHLEDDDGRVLLGLRHPASLYAGNTWHFLAGRCEQESALACLVREAWEEARLVIDPADAELVHVVHVVDTPGGQPVLQLVFRAHRWKGVPEVREPDKCLAWKWWPRQELPDPIVPYAREAITGITQGRAYTELGWEEQA